MLSYQNLARDLPLAKSFFWGRTVLHIIVMSIRVYIYIYIINRYRYIEYRYMEVSRKRGTPSHHPF